METQKRTLLKAVIWRIISLVLSWLAVYLYTGETEKATSFSLIIAGVLFVGYYVNERVWDKIDWGRKKKA